jgi:hypothetical protein
LLSVAALDGVTSATGAGADEASVSAEVALAFFFFEDLDSDLTCGFWVAEAAIVEQVRAVEGDLVVVQWVGRAWMRIIFVGELRDQDEESIKARL